MKVPFTSGIAMFFRIFLPGALLSVVFWPLIGRLDQVTGLHFSNEYAITIFILFFGWIIATSDTQIYMLYEGRRYWPIYLRKICVQRQQERLKRLLETEEATHQKIEKEKVKSRTVDEDNKEDNKRRYQEASVEIRKFPINDDGEPIAKWPTRLGNLRASFEEYPGRIYGVDAIFYWRYIFLKTDKDIREHMDNYQARGDSTLYLSFGFLISSIMAFVYFLVKVINQNSSLMLPSIVAIISLMIIFIFLSYVTYRVSVEAQAQFGQMFKAVFDEYITKLDFEYVIHEIADLTGDSEIEHKSKKEQYVAVWRYLHNYRIKEPKSGEIVHASRFWKSHKP